MTTAEANEKCKLLAKLNLDIWRTPSMYDKSKLRIEFKNTWKEIASNGFKILSSKKFDSTLGYKVPFFKIRDDGSESLVSIIDNRTANGYHIGDCTTRCISFCTGVPYDVIQKEQFANAHGPYTWRNTAIYSKSLLSRGFCKLTLPKHVSAKVFLRKFSNCGIDDGIIAAESAHHVAAIDMKTKKILDTWNSAGCRIKSIFVPAAQKFVWMAKLNAILR